jgi:hypothetical protein
MLVFASHLSNVVDDVEIVIDHATIARESSR